MARVWAESVGCKISRADAESLLAQLLGEGYAVAASADEADIAVVTTCCVTAEAERSSRQRVSRLAAKGLPVVVTGCAVVYRSEQFTRDGVVTATREGVPAAVAAALAREAAPSAVTGASGATGGEAGSLPARRRTRSVLKVQDGCTSICAYCAVRLVRGEPWSLPLADAVNAARAALRSGCGELVISGINLGLYAGERDARGPAGLAELVAGLVELPGLRRLRLSSIEPPHVDERLLEVLAHARVARHLHVPLQSADDGVLADMGRPYTFARYRDTLAAVRAALPGAMISTDVIVGFPTESAAAFERTLAAIDGPDGLFGRVHVFTYSPRPGTPAARLAPLPAAELQRRRAAALAAAAAAQEAAAQRLVGGTVEVLLEDRRGGRWRGYSSEYARCRVTGVGRRGALVTARVRERVGTELSCDIV